MSVSLRYAPVGAPEQSRRQRLPALVVAVLTAAAFGPYTSFPGVRTEQIAVYSTAVLCVATWLSHRPRPTRAALLVGALLATEIAIAVVGGLLPPYNSSHYATGSFMAGMDNMMLPLAVLVVVVTLTSRGADSARLLRVVAVVLVAAMCFNSLLALASINHDMTGVLSAFWDNQHPGGVFGGQHAANSGRYVGLINEPAEAGELYACGLLAAIYLLRARAGWLAATSALMIMGGVLAISKTFLFVGLPVAGWQLLRAFAQRPGRVVPLALAVGAGLPLLLSGTGWAGAATLQGLLTGGGGATLYTAGRFGEDSTLAPVVHAVLSASPWFGFGAPGIVVALDNGWVEALTVAGICGAILYTLILGTMAATWIRRHRDWTPERSRFAGGLVLVLIGASTGLPALTVNRVATVVWLLAGLLLFSRSEQGQESRGGRGEEPSRVAGHVGRVEPGVPTRTAGGLAVLDGQVVAAHHATRLGQGGLRSRR